MWTIKFNNQKQLKSTRVYQATLYMQHMQVKSSDYHDILMGKSMFILFSCLVRFPGDKALLSLFLGFGVIVEKIEEWIKILH